MAWYHVNSCDCPIGDCDCGTPRTVPSKKRKRQAQAEADKELVIVMRAAKEEGICLDCGENLDQCFCGEIYD